MSLCCLTGTSRGTGRVHIGFWYSSLFPAQRDVYFFFTVRQDIAGPLFTKGLTFSATNFMDLVHNPGLTVLGSLAARVIALQPTTPLAGDSVFLQLRITSNAVSFGGEQLALPAAAVDGPVRWGTTASQAAEWSTCNAVNAARPCLSVAVGYRRGGVPHWSIDHPRGDQGPDPGFNEEGVRGLGGGPPTIPLLDT